MHEREEKRIKLMARLMLFYKQPFSEFARLETEILEVLAEEARIILTAERLQKEQQKQEN